MKITVRTNNFLEQQKYGKYRIYSTTEKILNYLNILMLTVIKYTI